MKLLQIKLIIKNIFNFKSNNISDFIENIIKYSRLLKKYITFEKNKNPNKYIDIDNILKDYKNLNKKFNSTNNPIFILSLLSKCFEKFGIKIFVTSEKDKNLNKIGIASIQLLFCLLGQKKYEIHFDFGEKKNQTILNDDKEKENFISEYKEKLCKAFKIESKKFIFTDIHYGSVEGTAFFLDPVNENPIDLLNDKDRQDFAYNQD